MTACLFLVLCGRFGPQADLEVRIPEPPEHWARAFPDLGFVLTFPDCAGRWQSLAVTDAGRPALISCSKAGNTPVLAYPVARRSLGLLRPAGGLYPTDLVDQGEHPRLALSWQSGFLAEIFAHLCERGLDTSLVNSERLASYIGRHADPWALDLDAIVEKLILDDFSAYDIDLLPARDVTLHPGAGEWFPESPLAQSCRTTEADALTLPGLSLGMHALFSVEGGRSRIWVGEGETLIGPRE